MNDEYCRKRLQELSRMFWRPYDPEIAKVIHFKFRPLIEQNQNLRSEFDSHLYLADHSPLNHKNHFSNVWEAMQSIKEMGFEHGLPVFPYDLSSDFSVVIRGLLRFLNESGDQTSSHELQRRKTEVEAEKPVNIAGIEIFQSSGLVRFSNHSKLYRQRTQGRMIINRCLGNDPIGQVDIKFLTIQGKSLNDIDGLLKDTNAEWRLKTGHRIFNRRGTVIYIAPIRAEAVVRRKV